MSTRQKVYLMGLVLGLVLSLALSARAEESNLLKNPGFEIDKNKDGIPDDWIAHRQNKKEEIELSLSNDAHSGKYCAYMKGEETCNHGGWVQTIHLLPNTTYILSTWLKMKNVKKLKVHVCYVGYISKLGKSYDQRLKVIKNADTGGEWKCFEFKFTTPGEDVLKYRHYMFPGIFHNRGEVWIDDVSLRKIGGEACVIGQCILSHLGLAQK